MNATRMPILYPVSGDALPSEGVFALCQNRRVYAVLDGASAKTSENWAQAGCTVIRHCVALGFGRCVKSGLNRILADEPECSGALILRNPVPEDVLALAEEALEPDVPMLAAAFPEPILWTRRQRMKNRMFSILGTLLGGRRHALPSDACLVGLSGAVLARAAVFSGESGNYLPGLFLNLRRENLRAVRLPDLAVKPPEPLPISVAEWLQMTLTTMGFLLASAASFLVDYGLFALFYFGFSIPRTLCAILSRAISSVFNFTVNRKLVFSVRGRKSNLLAELLQYYSLVGLVLAANVALLALFNSVLGIPVMIAKLFTEVILFVVNYIVQRDVIFHERRWRRKKQA